MSAPINSMLLRLDIQTHNKQYSCLLFVMTNVVIFVPHIMLKHYIDSLIDINLQFYITLQGSKSSSA